MIAMAEFARVCPHHTMRQDFHSFYGWIPYKCKCALLCLSVLYLTGWPLSFWMSTDKAVLDTDMPLFTFPGSMLWYNFQVIQHLCEFSKKRSCAVFHPEYMRASSSRARCMLQWEDYKLETILGYVGRPVLAKQTLLHLHQCVLWSVFYCRNLGSVTRELVFKCCLFWGPLCSFRAVINTEVAQSIYYFIFLYCTMCACA